MKREIVGESDIERVTLFADQWEQNTQYSGDVYTLGRMEGDYVLTIADLRSLAADAQRYRSGMQRLIALEQAAALCEEDNPDPFEGGHYAMKIRLLKLIPHELPL